MQPNRHYREEWKASLLKSGAVAFSSLDVLYNSHIAFLVPTVGDATEYHKPKHLEDIPSLDL